MTMVSAGTIRDEYLPDGGVQWHLGLVLDLPYWAMRSATYHLIRMAIEMASKSAAFFLLLIICRA